MGSPVQQRHRPVGVGPEEGCEDDQSNGTSLLCRNAGNVGAVQPDEEKLWENLTVAFRFLTGAIRWRRVFCQGLE